MEYDDLPKEVIDIVDTYEESGDLYGECRRIKFELEKIGWTCEYGLDGDIYDIKEQ